MMTLDAAPQRPTNPEVRIEVVKPAANRALHELAVQEGNPRGLVFHLSQDARIGGEWIVAWLDGKPAGRAGWWEFLKLVGE